MLSAVLADAPRGRGWPRAFNQPPQSRIANTTIMVIAVINGRGNPVISLVALDEPPAHRRRYEMNLLSRRSVLAIAAVVDVALHSRSAPVAAKALAARHKLPPRHLEMRP